MIESPIKLHVLHFILNNFHFGIEVQYISKVIPLVFLEPVPGSPPYLVGLMNLGGQTLPVVDLGLWLNIERNKNYTLDTPILICSNQQKKVGIIVDKIFDILDVDEVSLQMKKEFSDSSSIFVGPIAIDMNLLLLIDIRKLLDINTINNDLINRDLPFNGVGGKYESTA